VEFNQQLISKIDEEISLLKKLIDINRNQLELLSNIYRIFSKYDEQYLVEMEKEGFKPPT